MHDLIQSMDELFDDLPFEFKVIAERGKNTSSKNILYAKFPFLKKYTQTYIRPHTIASSANAKTLRGKHESEEVNSKPDVKVVSAVFPSDEVPQSEVPQCEKVVLSHSQVPRLVNVEPKSLLVDESSVSDSSIMAPTSHEMSDSENFILKISKFFYRMLKRSYRMVKRLLKRSYRLLKRSYRVVKRLLKRSYRKLKSLLRRSKKIKRYFVVQVKKLTNFFSILQQFRLGLAHPIVWKWCRKYAISNVDKVGKVDVFHIVRPNATSDKMLEKLLETNPNMKVIVGPNLMAYGHPSNGFDYKDFVDQKISRVLGISSYHSILLNEFGFSNELITRLPPSVNPNYFSPNNMPRDDKVFTIIFVASQFSVEKGALEFLNTINKLEIENRIEFRAVMIGGFGVNKSVQTPVSDEAWDKASKKITFPGKVSRVDMQQYYRSADVFLHTGESENGPTTIIEALSCGTKCILPEHVCFREPELNEGAYYYQKGNLDEITEFIYQIESVKKDYQPRFLPKSTHQDSIDYMSALYQSVHNEVS